FNGGYIHKNYSLNNPTDISVMAQIEAFDITLSNMKDQIQNIPDLQFKDGDLLGLMIYDGFVIWFETVGISGQTIMSDFGTKYILNRRDDLKLSPMID
ncbi:MAG: hypothetical protein ACK5LJ_03720, partial [Paracoccus sp. (in: a-proteobacteria)]